MHAFIYQFKILMRSKELLFWSLIFPLCLASFFKLAFSDILSNETLEPFNIAYVEVNTNDSFKEVIDYMAQDNDNQMFNIKYVNENKAKQLLKDEKIDGYYLVNDEINVCVDKEDVNQTIMKTIADNYIQTSATMTNIYEIKPEVFYSSIINDIDLQRDNFKEEKINNLDLTVIYFYTLIGMTCLTGGSWAITVTSQKEGNLSRQGSRLCIAPTSKLLNLVIGLTSAFIIHYIQCLILFAFMIFVLDVNFGNQVGYIMLLMAAGCFVGITLGNLVSNLLKCSKDSKVSIFTSITLIFSFLAGMMGTTDIKYMLQTSFPILANINPVNLITDALYSLYYFATYDRFYTNLFYLVVIGFVLALISLLFMRRKKYDSI